MSLWTVCGISAVMVIAMHLGARLMLATMRRLGPLKSLIAAGAIALMWPAISQASAPLTEAMDIEARLDALRAIAAEAPVMDVESCSDEEMAHCYELRKSQYADQMQRFLHIMEAIQLELRAVEEETTLARR